MTTKQKKIDENKEMLPLSIRANVVPSSFDEKEMTVRCEYTTGAKVYRQNYFEEDYV